MRSDSLKNEFLGGKRLQIKTIEDQEDFRHLRRLDSGADYIKIDIRNIVLASLLPDEIIMNPKAIGEKSYIVVLLLGDIAGFTDLCDKYARTGKGKTSHITEIINAYIGEMVKAIYEFDGDVMNFSGDAYLAMWKIKPTDNYFDVIEKVIDCALYIQKYTGFYETEVNVLSVKLAISMGQCYVLWLGDERRKEFILHGQAVMDVKESAHYCDSRELIISPTAWLNCNSLKYRHEPHPNGKHIRITGYSKIFEVHSFKLDIDKSAIEKRQNIEYLFKLRPMLKYATDNKLEDELKIYMMAPVIKALDMNQSVEYLTEMRQVVILFLNIITQEKKTDPFSETVNECYTIVSNIVEAADGTVNKISLFDKDLMFLIIFGLRYFTQTMVAQTALKCAISLKTAIQAIPNVQIVSVGVTTGIVYCGIVGHSIRREYTVMGLTVNKAARLMVAYQNKVTCDRETFLYSRMGYENFTLQEPKELKGISNVGPIYMYTPKRTEIEKKHRASGSIFPLLGRDKEIALFKKIIFEKIKNHNLNSDKNISTDIFNIMTIAFLGETRQGKTRILDEIAHTTQNLVKIYSLSLTPEIRKVPYSSLRSILYGALNIKKNSTVYERESIIESKIDAKSKKYNILCGLNESMNVKFIETSMYSKLTRDYKKRIQNIMIQELAAECFKEVTVITVDNAEFIDVESWKVLHILAKQKTLLLILAIGSRFELLDYAKIYLAKKFVLGIKLKGIHKWYHIGIACQILEVIAIPNSILRLIQRESNGNPGWIESYLLSSIQSGFLYIKTCSQEKLPNYCYVNSLIIVPKHMIETNEWLNIHILLDQWAIYLNTFVRKHSTEFDIFNIGSLPTTKKTVAICLIQGKIIEDVPQTMDTLILMIFDNLPPFLQLFLKCCSTLGDSFTRQTVIEILQNAPTDMTRAAIKKLFNLKVLGCASERKVKRGSILKETDNECYCELPENDALQNDDYLTNHGNCQLLRFRSSTFRDTTYALLTNQEKKIYHSRILQLNKKKLRRCFACHSVPFGDIGLKKELKKQLVDENRQIYELDQRLVIGEELFQAERPTDICTPGILEGLIFIVNPCYNYLAYNKKQQSPLNSECHCREILYNYYSETIKHSILSDNLENTINLLLSFIPILISLSNITFALKTIAETEDFVEKCKKSIEPEYLWKIKCAECLLKMFLSLCFFESGEIDNAYNGIISAMKELGIKFPKSEKEVSVLLNIKILKLRLFALFMEKRKIKNTKIETCMIKFLGTQCINIMYTICMQKKHWSNILLCATWSLHNSFTTATDFRFFSVSVSNFFSIGNIYYNITSLVTALEVICLKLCSLKATNIPEREKQFIISIYCSIFSCRIVTGNINDGIDIGTIILNFTTPAEKSNLVVDIIPWLIYANMTRLQFDDILPLLIQLKSSCQYETQHLCLSWYYVCLIIILLHTGVDLINYDELESFIYHNYFKLFSKLNRAQNIFTYCLWLLCERAGFWNVSNIWLPSKILEGKLERTQLIAVILVLEGLLRNLTKNYFSERSLQCFRIYRQISKSVEEILHLIPLIKPSYYYLKAWFNYTYFLVDKAFKYLKISNKWAKKQGNYLAMVNVEFTESIWQTDQKSKKDGKTLKPKILQRKITLARPLAYEEKLIREITLVSLSLPIA